MGLDDQFDWFHDTWISSIQFIHENDDGNTSLSDLVISAEYLDQSGAREKSIFD